MVDPEIGAAFLALAELGDQWWPEVGRMTNGQWYCELCLGAAKIQDVGPAIRVIKDTPAEAIFAALAMIQVKATRN